MFENHKVKKAEELYKTQLDEWQPEHDELAAVLRLQRPDGDHRVKTSS